MEKNLKIEQRIQNMKNIYTKVDSLLDKLTNVIPEKHIDSLRNAILGDKELTKFMEAIDSHRPPRIFMIGRTGVGKSSLINAICGSYVASVNDIRSCTNKTQIHKCMEGDRVLLEICDTRGIAETESLDKTISAEDMLIKEINEFSPDIALFVLHCGRRDDVVSDIHFLKKLANNYAEINKAKLPVVVVVNRCDEMPPARLKDPAEYTNKKKETINEAVKFYKSIIMKEGLSIESIIPVSSLVEWRTADGEDISVEEIDRLPREEREAVQIAFDGRYQIEGLYEKLLAAIPDCGAQMGLRMAARLNEVVKRLAKHLNGLFTTIAGIIAATPIPISDIYILTFLQAVLVALIAALGGRDLNLDTAKEFVYSMGGVAGLGYTFRVAAQQLSKLLNGLWPGVGSVISASIASVGTGAIGKAATAYYIEGISIDGAKKLFNEAKKSEQQN